MEERKLKIRAFFARFFNAAGLSDDDDIFEIGFVNSLFAIQLVLFIEQTFDLKVENDDLELANFRSVTAIAELVERKLNAQPAPPASA